MSILDDIRKKYGEGAVFSFDDSPLIIPVIPTGSFKLDCALGVGGVPKGRIVEIFGPETSGKTTICQHIVGNVQRMGEKAAFVDIEHATDPLWFEVCGVDFDDLYVSQPDTGEQALDITEMFVRSGEVSVVVVDSVAALVPRAEIEGEFGDSHMGLQARLMSQAMRKLSGPIKEYNVSVIFTNQLRHKIGVTWGSPETTTGGHALKYYASIRIDTRNIGKVKDRDEIIGSKIRATVKKNKVAPPFQIAEFEIIAGEGISKLSELLDLSVEHNIIQKRAAYYYYGEEKIGQGREKAKNYLRENQELTLKVENDIRSILRLPLVEKEE